MKRHPALQPLSDDHHGALVLARRLRRLPEAMAPADLEPLAFEVRQKFEVELEPHFRTEEDRLLPILVRRGAAALVDRTLDDHARLRQLVGGDWVPGTAQEIGTLLEQHVRFEERVLFPEAESLLSERELASVCGAPASP
ncbi:MAG: hemerythrin domain-containing protein [Myxococcota bacterium]